jgi:hypothetical protein
MRDACRCRALATCRGVSQDRIVGGPVLPACVAVKRGQGLRWAPARLGVGARAPPVRPVIVIDEHWPHPDSDGMPRRGGALEFSDGARDAGTTVVDFVP